MHVRAVAVGGVHDPVTGIRPDEGD